MPKRDDIHTVMIIGAGPIVIGQACEFDYSGVQACKALREEGYRVVLINSTPATIMTDPAMADATYVEPITPEMAEKVIAAERDKCDGVFALLPTMGGQTALNCALALEQNGALERHNVEMIGARADAIDKAEDRKRFRDAMESIGLESPRARLATTPAEAEAALELTGLPCIIRPSFTLGGTGGGIAYNREEFTEIVANGLAASPVTQVLVEESLVGWKEYEMEVVRDRADNAIIVCSIENIDAMGIHTGDSWAVAPAMTLTDREYQRMRDAAIAVLREIGVETGGSNVQFAVDPKDGRMVVIEMNPRVSRSSALASKATGFPIAKVAAKLAVGYTLDELENDITGGATPASFEPTLDYVVVKAPRFAFEKFAGTNTNLTTSMKSVGEAMAIGRTFPEALQKAYRSLETGLDGLDEMVVDGAATDQPSRPMIAALSDPMPDRLRLCAEALRRGHTVEEIAAVTGYDPWFLRHINHIIDAERWIVRRSENLAGWTAATWLDLKQLGFADARIAKLTGAAEMDVRQARHASGAPRPVFKRVDTCAAEFRAETPYMYSSYEAELSTPDDAPVIGQCEAAPDHVKKIIILGGGPNRIGQGIEFDYCCCHAAFACTDMGVQSIMVNCNPETVSTDYDTADRLYFEPLTVENVLDIIEKERETGEILGVIVQFGGQTPLKLARSLEAAGAPILGATFDAIDRAEDRERFTQLLNDLGLNQAPNALARSPEEAFAAAEKLGFPLMLRPSYVLGGRAMEVVRDENDLETYVRDAVVVSGDAPLLVDRYLTDAVEVDVDAICDGEDVFVAGVMQHIEEAGVHSGDSACALPPFSLPPDIIDELHDQTHLLATALGARGLINIQFAIQGQTIFVLEVNPRASRTVPFVAKATGVPVARIATKVMAGGMLSDLAPEMRPLDHIAVKEAVMPFRRFPGADPILGPEMRSTGEVMGIDSAFALAFAKSQMGANISLPQTGTAFVSVKDSDKLSAAPLARALIAAGFAVIATRGTAEFLQKQNIDVKPVLKVYEGRPNIVDAIKNGEVTFICNTTEGRQALRDSFSIRHTALSMGVPCYTTVRGAHAAVDAITASAAGALEVRSLQSYSLTA